MTLTEAFAGVVFKKGIEVALRISGEKYDEYINKSSFIGDSKTEFHKIIKFKKGNQPKMDYLNKALHDFLKKYGYDQHSETINLKYNSGVADVAMGYYMYSEVIYTPELLENLENINMNPGDSMDPEDIYDYSIVDDITMSIIPNFVGKNNDEIKLIIYKIYEYFEDLENTLKKDYFVSSSHLKMNLIFSEKVNAEKFKQEANKKLDLSGISKIGDIEENMDKKITISIKNPDQIFVERILKEGYLKPLNVNWGDIVVKSCKLMKINPTKIPVLLKGLSKGKK